MEEGHENDLVRVLAEIHVAAVEQDPAERIDDEVGVAVQNGKKCFIQVAYIMIDEATVKREFGAFASVRDASPKYVISMDPFDMSMDGITHINLLNLLEGRKDLYLS